MCNSRAIYTKTGVKANVYQLILRIYHFILLQLFLTTTSIRGLTEILRRQDTGLILLQDLIPYSGMRGIQWKLTCFLLLEYSNLSI